MGSRTSVSSEALISIAHGVTQLGLENAEDHLDECARFLAELLLVNPIGVFTFDQDALV